MSEILLYGFPLSANSHRVSLALSLLGLPFEERRIDLVKVEQRGEAFTAINPRQRVPALVYDGCVSTESFSIIAYLAERLGGEEGERWWPADPADRAEVASWLYYAANELHNGVGLARNERAFNIPSSGDYAAGRGSAALTLLEQHLGSREYLALGRPTLADVAVYPFVAVAPEAGLPLDDYPAIRAWIDRLTALPGFTPMPLLKDFFR